jgi:hypothetical protein
MDFLAAEPDCSNPDGYHHYIIPPSTVEPVPGRAPESGVNAGLAPQSNIWGITTQLSLYYIEPACNEYRE